MKPYSTRSLLIGVALVISVVALCACVANAPTRATERPPSALDRVFRGMMDGTDLPSGWGGRRDNIVQDPTGIGRGVVYYGANPREKPWVNVSQTLVIYPDEQQAETSYRGAVARAIPPAYAEEWTKPAELDFSSHADNIVVACTPESINDIPVKSCKIVGQYGNMVMTLYGTVFEDRWLTMAQFRHLLERVDARMDAARK